MKIITVVGTRPEIIKLSRVLFELDKHFDHFIVHTGQNFDFELNQIFFEEMNIRKPDFFLNCVGNNAAETIANVIKSSDKIFNDLKPDAVLILGDTNSCLCALSAKRRKIPIFHMEAGNRCFDLRVPEEINRKLVDNLSDINLPYTEHARNYLLNEGFDPAQVIKTGSPMFEVLSYHKDSIDNSDILEKLSLTKNNYFVVSAHREENVDNPDNFRNLLLSLNRLATDYNKRIVFSTHPRTYKKISQLKNLELNPLIELIKPLGFFDYISLQMNSMCVVSDSGTITEEASILNFPAITIRQAHERPEGMDEGVLIMSGLTPDIVSQSIKLTINMDRSSNRIVSDYNVNKVSLKVVKIIMSYTEYVNRVVWKKYL